MKTVNQLTIGETGMVDTREPHANTRVFNSGRYEITRTKEGVFVYSADF